MDQIDPERLVRRSISSTADVESIRRAARAMATGLVFNRYDCESIVLAVSELATNLIRHARGGEITISRVTGTDRDCLEIESQDQGPGIADVGQALKDGYSTVGGLGGGLPAVRRLMDDFKVETSPCGTRMIARKWLNNR